MLHFYTPQNSNSNWPSRQVRSVIYLFNFFMFYPPPPPPNSHTICLITAWTKFIYYYKCFWKNVRVPVCLFLYKAPVLLLILLPLINITKSLMFPFYLYYRVLNPFSGWEAWLITKKWVVICVISACFLTSSCRWIN